MLCKNDEINQNDETNEFIRKNFMVLISGGAGYIGSHINKILNKKGYKTVVFDSLICGHREFVKWGDFFKGDLGNKEDLRLCFRKFSIKAVIHLGAFINAGESVFEPSKFYNNNVVNTLNLLDVMKEFNVKNIVFSSTAAIYGEPNEIPINEKHIQNPINPYGKTKFIIEKILEDYDKAYNIKYISLRYFNAAGADFETEIGERHNPETHLIPLTIFAALGVRDCIKILGTDYPTKDGTCIRDYIHVCDLADAHIKALEYLLSTNKSDFFNLGSEQGYSVKEIIETVEKINRKKFKVSEAQRRAGDPPILISSSQKAYEVLKWKPLCSDIETIVETAWKWHSCNNKNTSEKRGLN